MESALTITCAKNCVYLTWRQGDRSCVQFTRRIHFSKHFRCKSCHHRTSSSSHVGDVRLQCRHPAVDEVGHHSTPTRKSFISISYDALDKIRCGSITNPKKIEAQPHDRGFRHWYHKERAREQSWHNSQIWHAGFHESHECRRRHAQDWTFRRWVLFGAFGFRHGSCNQQEQRSICESVVAAPSKWRKTDMVHAEAKRGTKREGQADF